MRSQERDSILLPVLQRRVPVIHMPDLRPSDFAVAVVLPQINTNAAGATSHASVAEANRDILAATPLLVICLRHFRKSRQWREIRKLSCRSMFVPACTSGQNFRVNPNRPGLLHPCRRCRLRLSRSFAHAPDEAFFIGHGCSYRDERRNAAPCREYCAVGRCDSAICCIERSKCVVW